MRDQRTIDQEKPSGSRRSDDNKKPDAKRNERRFVDALLEDPDDPMICRGIE